MRSRQLLRSGLASAMVALFLAGSVAEAAGLHRCSHHDMVAGHSMQADAAHGEEHEEHGCTCFGTCHGSAAVALPAGPGDVHARAHDSLAGRFHAASPPTAQASSYLLPYANGPPTP